MAKKKGKKGKSTTDKLYVNGGANIKEGRYGEYLMIQLDPNDLLKQIKKNKKEVIRTWEDRDGNEHESVTLFAYEKQDKSKKDFLDFYLVLAPKSEKKKGGRGRGGKNRRR